MRNSLEKHRNYIRARISTVSSHCPICIKNNKNGILRVRPISELHHIFGRERRDPKDVRESVFGLMGLCNNHHQEYPPLLSLNEYNTNKQKWDYFFEAYWSYIGLFTFLQPEEKELLKKLFSFSTEELITYFLEGHTIG
jgi:hypothetical protein